jgi:hypothetical protein
VEELVDRLQPGRVLDPRRVEDERAGPDVLVGQDLADLGAERRERRGDGVAHAAVPADHGGPGERRLTGLVAAERARLGQSEPLGDQAPRRERGELLVAIRWHI